MVALAHRLQSIADIAGPARRAQIDAILRSRPLIARALLECVDPLRVADALMHVCALIGMESEGHARRLASGMRLLGGALGLAPGALLELELGALVHDVGKLSVEDAILQSADTLTPTALDKIRMHCSLGHAVLFGVPGLRGAAELVLHHHEYWDGTGYSEGRSAHEIPLSARIFAVVDSYDAMVRGDRAFRVAMTHAEARAEITALAGEKYDPAIVATFLAIDRSDWERPWRLAEQTGEAPSVSGTLGA